MRLWEILQGYTVPSLKELAGVLGGPGPEGNRKEQLVGYIHEHLTSPETLTRLWQDLNDLSKKAVAAAYHGGGTLNEEAFFARYGDLPGRRGSGVFDDLADEIGFMIGSRREPETLDLFLYRNRLPRELMGPLAELVPPPEKFVPESFETTPHALEMEGERFTLLRADTEEAGPHDVAAYLRLYVRGELSGSSAQDRMTTKGAGNLLQNLLDGDFLAHAERARPADTIRPSGLDRFVGGANLTYQHRDRRRLTDAGEALLRYRDPEALLDAFEIWSTGGSDELGRIKALKGLNAKRTHLTPPAERREAIIEALSWCPAGAWISTGEFYRALVIWEFDIELDRGYESRLCIEDPVYGRTYYAEPDGRSLIETLYINAVLMEPLASIGALDVLYLPPAEAGLGYDPSGSYYSLYDGLFFFRINPLGSYLLGQSEEYIPTRTLDAPLFTIDSDFGLTLKDPEALTPNLRDRLHQVAIEDSPQHYHLDTRRVLDTLESGEELESLSEFLRTHHEGPLPEQVTGWLARIEDHTGAFQDAGDALFVKARSRELLQMAAEDPVIAKFARTTGARTLVIPRSKEKAFRKRLKELEYLLAEQR